MQRRSRFALAVLAGAAGLLTLPLAAKDPVPAPQPRSEFVWTNDGEGLFGGFSAIEISSNGQTFLAISDSGAFVHGRITRDRTGRITAVKALETVTGLLGPRGGQLGENDDDSEGLALLPDGTAFVSFEGPARVLRYRAIGGVPTMLPVPGAFRAMQKNSSLEALAVAADGTLYAIPERSGRIDRPFAVFRLDHGAWDQPFDLPRDGVLLPVSADIGPDGRLYVLEREFLGLAGFRTRLRSFAIAGDTLGDERRLLDTQTGRHGNLEGVSVWRDGAGHLVATMIADNNYKWYLATEIVEYDLGPRGIGVADAG